MFYFFHILFLHSSQFLLISCLSRSYVEDLEAALARWSEREVSVQQLLQQLQRLQQLVDSHKRLRDEDRRRHHEAEASLTERVEELQHELARLDPDEKVPKLNFLRNTGGYLLKIALPLIMYCQPILCCALLQLIAEARDRHEELVALLQERASAHGVQRQLMRDAQQLVQQISLSMKQPMETLRDRDTGRVYETKEGELCFRRALNSLSCLCASDLKPSASLAPESLIESSHLSHMLFRLCRPCAVAETGVLATAEFLSRAPEGTATPSVFLLHPRLRLSLAKETTLAKVCDWTRLALLSLLPLLLPAFLLLLHPPMLQSLLALVLSQQCPAPSSCLPCASQGPPSLMPLEEVAAVAADTYEARAASDSVQQQHKLSLVDALEETLTLKFPTHQDAQKKLASITQTLLLLQRQQHLQLEQKQQDHSDCCLRRSVLRFARWGKAPPALLKFRILLQMQKTYRGNSIWDI